MIYEKWRYYSTIVLHNDFLLIYLLSLCQARLSEVEGENARLKSMLKQKDEEVEGIDKVAKRLQDERGKVADIIRQEFADRFVVCISDKGRISLYRISVCFKIHCQADK